MKDTAPLENSDTITILDASYPDIARGIIDSVRDGLVEQDRIVRTLEGVIANLKALLERIDNDVQREHVISMMAEANTYLTSSEEA